MTSYHPDYGLTDEMRQKTLKDAEIYGVKQAAALNNVSPGSIYRWRKDITPKGNP